MTSIQPTSQPASVLIVDDHAELCRSIERHLELDRSYSVCGTVLEAANIHHAIRNLKPDVVLLDLALGEDNGLFIARQIRVENPDLPILVLSIHQEALYALPALKAGANGYLMKSDASENLLTALHTVLAGRTYLSPDLTDRLQMKSEG